MKRLPSILVILGTVIGIIFLVRPRTDHSLRTTGPLICYVGGTMTPVFEALADAYREATGREVEITSADSGELLASIEMHLRGDLYVAHDPFMDIAMARGIGVNAWSLAEIYPVIVVQKGNPKGIESLHDFMRPDVQVYLTDYHHSTLGNMLPLIFERAGMSFPKLNGTKKIPTHRSGSWVANQIIMNAADVALVWQAVAFLRRKDLDAIPIDDVLPRPGVDAITSATGRRYYVTPVKVNIVSLACSQRQDDAKAFVTFASSPTGGKIFQEYGFKVSDIFGREQYLNGVRLKSAGPIGPPAASEDAVDSTDGAGQQLETKPSSTQQ